MFLSHRFALAAVLTLIFPLAASAQELCGVWHGYWTDCKSGHEGKLNGRFTPCGDNAYDVVFTGTFFQVIPFRFRTTLNVVGRDGEKIHFAGTSRIPFFGEYTYNGWATCDRFEMEYCSRRYEGKFVLCR